MRPTSENETTERADCCLRLLHHLSPLAHLIVIARRRRLRMETRGVLPKRRRPLQEYAGAVTDWLLRAQSASPDGGVAHGYDPLAGAWLPSYPETSGYIICSLLRAAESGIRDRAQLRVVASRIGAWLLGTQLECGAFPDGHVGNSRKAPTVFNTGQILKGLTDLIVEGLDADGRVRDAARRAAGWLINVQNENGAWLDGRSPLTKGPVHSYDVRTAWALSRYGLKCDSPDAVSAGIRNAEWLCSTQQADGWFPHMSFDPQVPPLTHTVAYTIQGLLELGIIARRQEFIDAAADAAGRMKSLVIGDTGAIAGQVGPSYSNCVEWSSSTGNAQMSIIWFRLAQLVSDSSWQQPAIAAIDFNCSLQELDMNARNPGRYGAVRGSYPGHVGYGRFYYMNWAQKFHLDALLAAMGAAIV